MKIQITVDTKDQTSIDEAIELLETFDGEEAVEETPTPKKSKTTSMQPKKKKAVAAEDEAGLEAADEDEEPVKTKSRGRPKKEVEAADEDEVTKEDIVAALMKYGKAQGKGDTALGRKAVRKILKQFKVESPEDLDEGDYTEFMEAIS